MNFKEFEELINSGAKEIHLNENVILDENENYKKGIEIKTECLVIDGNGYSIDAKNRAKALNIQADKVTLKNLKFKKCVSNDGNGGGAIENWGKDLSVKQCYFDNNHTNCYPGGGAICNFENMNLESCTFEKNTSNDSDGGAIYTETFGYSPIKVVLKNCDFKNNCANGHFKDFGSNAGAIYNKNTNLFLFNCNFEDNGVVSAYISNSESILNEEGFIILDNCCLKTRKSHSIFNNGIVILNNSRFYHDFKRKFEIQGSIFNRGSAGLIHDEQGQYKVELNGRKLNNSNIKDLINEYKTVYYSDRNEERIFFKKNCINPINDFKLDNYEDDEYLKSLIENNMVLISSGDYEDYNEFESN